MARIIINLTIVVIVIGLLFLIFKAPITEQELAVFAGVVGSLLTVLISDLNDWLSRPILSFSFDFNSPACSFTSIDNQEAFYLRIKVLNSGRESAENVQVLISNLRKLETNNEWERASNFLDCELVWTHNLNLGLNDILPFLSPKGARLIDVGYFLRKLENIGFASVPGDRAEFHFCLKVIPNNSFEILKSGRYKFNLTIGAKNCSAKTWEYELLIGDSWSSNKDDLKNVIILGKRGLASRT